MTFPAFLRIAVLSTLVAAKEYAEANPNSATMTVRVPEISADKSMENASLWKTMQPATTRIHVPLMFAPQVVVRIHRSKMDFHVMTKTHVQAKMHVSTDFVWDAV